MADTMLHRWAEALGGLERLGQVAVVYTRARIEVGGLTGTVEEWLAVDGRHRQDQDLAGLFRTRQVYDGQRGWQRDQNGKVRELAGVELEEEAAAVYLGTFSHLVPGRRPGRVERVGPEGACEVWRALPEGGKPVTFYLDRASGRPARQEQPEAERTRTLFLDDWRPVEGVLFPFHMRQSTGDPRYDAVLTVEEVRLNGPLEAGLFAVPEEAAPDFAFSAGHSAPDIPIELNSNHIYLQAQLNGSAPLWFILDTGAGSTVVDSEQARLRGLELQGQLEGRGAGEGSVDVSFLRGATFGLPGVELRGQTIAALSLGALEPFEGRAIHGILGYDLISRFVVEIDYAAGRVHLHDPAHYAYTGPGESLALLLEGNVPYVAVQLGLPGREPVEGTFLLDTGARVAMVLNRPFVEANGLELDPTIAAPYGVGVGGETKQRLGRVAEVRLGRQVLRKVVAGLSQDVRGAGADPDRAGLIGGEVLRRFRVLFDYPGQRLILEPNAHQEEPYEYDMSGLFLAAAPPAFDRFRVHRVVEGSPAAEAGLREGDGIVAVAGRPAGEWTLEQVRQLFREDGRQVSLQVEREGASWQQALQLRRLI